MSITNINKQNHPNKSKDSHSENHLHVLERKGLLKKDSQMIVYYKLIRLNSKWRMLISTEFQPQFTEMTRSTVYKLVDESNTLHGYHTKDEIMEFNSPAEAIIETNYHLNYTNDEKGDYQVLDIRLLSYSTLSWWSRFTRGISDMFGSYKYYEHQ